MSLTSIDLYETDGLLLFRPKSIIRKTIDLERVIENAENIYYFYLDSNWELPIYSLVVWYQLPFVVFNLKAIYGAKWL